MLEFVHKGPQDKKRFKVTDNAYTVAEDVIKFKIVNGVARHVDFVRDSGNCSRNYYNYLNCGKWRLVQNEQYPNDEAHRSTVVSIARAMVGNEYYHALKANCEHFVTELLLGRRTSHLTDRQQ